MVKKENQTQERIPGFSYHPQLKLWIADNYLSEEPISAKEVHEKIGRNELRGTMTPLEYIAFIQDLETTNSKRFQQHRELGRPEILDALWEPLENGRGRLVISPRVVNDSYKTGDEINYDPETGQILHLDRNGLNSYFANSGFKINFPFTKTHPVDLYAVLGISDTTGNSLDAYSQVYLSSGEVQGPFGVREVIRK